MKLLLISLLILSGCANTHPYVEARHLSDPYVKDDGWNDVCGGAIYQGYNLQLKGGVCYNTIGYHGTRVDIGALWIMK